MKREVRIRARIECSGSTAFVPAPAGLLDPEYTARPVRVRSAGGSCRSRLLRRTSGDVVLLLDPDQSRMLGLCTAGDEIELWIEVIPENLRLQPPDDFAAALEDCRAEWNALPERDRHLAIGIVKEAPSPELRKTRIEMIRRSLNRSAS